VESKSKLPNPESGGVGSPPKYPTASGLLGPGFFGPPPERRRRKPIAKKPETK
jgi:hypothetical protein